MSSEIGAFYSLVRYLPDPLRDEPINVGLVLAAADGSWSRFDVRVPKTRLSAIGRRSDAEHIERWAQQIKAQFEVQGFGGLFAEYGRLDESIVREWAGDFGASIRFSEPRAAVDGSLDALWDSLFRSLVWTRGSYGPSVHVALASSRRSRDARGERAYLMQAFLAETRRWPTFDPGLIHLDATFDGRRGRHLADIAILNGRLTGVVQTLPLVYGTDSDVITKRALIVDAAIDVDERVEKIALYDDPPADRLELLDETLDVIAQLPKPSSIRVVSARDFARLEAQLGGVLFPELTSRGDLPRLG